MLEKEKNIFKDERIEFFFCIYFLFPVFCTESDGESFYPPLHP